MFIRKITKWNSTVFFFSMRQELKTLFAVAEGKLRRGKFVLFSICIKHVIKAGDNTHISIIMQQFHNDI